MGEREDENKFNVLSVTIHARAPQTVQRIYYLPFYACKISHNHFDHTLLFLHSSFFYRFDVVSFCFSIAR